jgi:hypothetical protein
MHPSTPILDAILYHLVLYIDFYVSMNSILSYYCIHIHHVNQWIENIWESILQSLNRSL